MLDTTAGRPGARHLCTLGIMRVQSTLALDRAHSVIRRDGFTSFTPSRAINRNRGLEWIGTGMVLRRKYLLGAVKFRQ